MDVAKLIFYMLPNYYWPIRLLGDLTAKLLQWSNPASDLTHAQYGSFFHNSIKLLDYPLIHVAMTPWEDRKTHLRRWKQLIMVHIFECWTSGHSLQLPGPKLNLNTRTQQHQTISINKLRFKPMIKLHSDNSQQNFTQHICSLHKISWGILSLK